MTIYAASQSDRRSLGTCIFSHMLSLGQILADARSEQSTSVATVPPMTMTELAAFCLRGVEVITFWKSSGFLITGSLLGGMAGLQEPSHTVHTTASDASSPRRFPSLECPLAAHTPAGRGPPAPLESPLWFCSAHGSSFPSRLQAKQDNRPLAQRPREHRSPRAPAPGFPMPAKLPQGLRPT